MSLHPSLPPVFRSASGARRWGVVAASLMLASAWAFPPAPHHLFYGMVRDEYGTPIQTASAQVVLETSNGTTLSTKVIADLEPGANYRLQVPMDSGLRNGVYTPTALRPLVGFRLKVRVGGVTYLPIEMRGDLAQLGLPGKRTQLNLTLGEDSDNDGLPDAWERLINQDISQVAPGADADGDGLSNTQEYLAGTYAFDPADGFRLELVRRADGPPALEFLALTGRTYRLEGSTDLKTWTPLRFRIPAEGANPPVRESYPSGDVRQIQAEVATALPADLAYFRLLVH